MSIAQPRLVGICVMIGRLPTTGNMPTSLTALLAEHRQIEALLDALEHYGESLERGDTPPLADLGELVSLLRSYADAHHHAKEEAILFRAMVAAGLSEDDGPVGFMLEQHEEGRRLVSDLADLAEQSTWSAAERASVTRLARDLAILLRAHIRDEDDVVYPLALSRLRPASWDGVERECAEHDTHGAKALALLTQRAATLVQRYPRR